jgi:hypothetical protein
MRASPFGRGAPDAAGAAGDQDGLTLKEVVLSIITDSLGRGLHRAVEVQALRKLAG